MNPSRHSTRSFRRTLCFHGYTGTADGSIRALFEDLVRQMGREAFGDVAFPTLPFSRLQGATLEDAPAERLRRLRSALDQPWEVQDTLCIGLSMGGLLAALLAQRYEAGTVVALSAPDHLNSRLAVDPKTPLDLLAVFSSKDDPILLGRTSRWAQVSPFAFDIDGLTHDHDQHRDAFALAIQGFLGMAKPCDIEFTIQQTMRSQIHMPYRDQLPTNGPGSTPEPSTKPKEFVIVIDDPDTGRAHVEVMEAEDDRPIMP